MNRGTFGLLVVLFCIALVVGMASCESKSGQIARQRAEASVTIVLDKHVATVALYSKFRVHKVGERAVYFWSTDQPYEVGDTVKTVLTRLQQ